MDNEAIAKDLARTLDILRSQRASWDGQWENLAEFTEPTLVGSFSGDGNREPTYEDNDDKIYDTTAREAGKKFAALMTSLLTSPKSKWIFLASSDDVLRRDRETQLFMDTLEDVIFEIINNPNSTFHRANYQFMRGLGFQGASCLYLDSSRNGPVFNSRPLGEIFIREDADGNVDTVFRRFWLTARQAFSKFDESKLPDTIHRAYEKRNTEDRFQFFQAVMPRKDADPYRPDSLGYPIASYYVAMDGPTLLEESGYRTMPYVVSRWDKAPGNVWPTSPALDCFPAIKSINEVAKDLLIQAQLTVSPPVLAHDDDVVDDDIVPGGIVFGGMSAEGRRLVDRFPTGDLRAGDTTLEHLGRQIFDAFYISDLQLFAEASSRMTAAEVYERAEERANVTVPILLCQFSQYHGPMTERIIDILAERELIPPMPRMLAEAGGEYAMQFQPPLVKMIQSSEWSTLSRLLEVATVFGNATQDPSVFDNFDVDRAIQGLAKRSPMPAAFLASEEERAAKRQARAEQQQIQTAIQAGPSVAAVAKATGE